MHNGEGEGNNRQFPTPPRFLHSFYMEGGNGGGGVIEQGSSRAPITITVHKKEWNDLGGGDKRDHSS